MAQRLQIALTQVKARYTSEDLLNEIRQVVYSLYQTKEKTKKVYNNMTSIKILSYKMNIVFMNSENSKTSDPHRLLINLADKINLKRSGTQTAFSNLSIYYIWKNINME